MIGEGGGWGTFSPPHAHKLRAQPVRTICAHGRQKTYPVPGPLGIAAAQSAP